VKGAHPDTPTLRRPPTPQEAGEFVAFNTQPPYVPDDDVTEVALLYPDDREALATDFETDLFHGYRPPEATYRLSAWLESMTRALRDRGGQIEPGSEVDDLLHLMSEAAAKLWRIAHEQASHAA
jgi:hypothetical protein